MSAAARINGLANDLRHAPLPVTLVHAERIELAIYLDELGYVRQIPPED